MYKKEINTFIRLLTVGFILPVFFLSCSKEKHEDAPKYTVIDKGLYGENSDVDEFNPLNGHDAVDLGLSVDWASNNLGANVPEDYGNYYAWGETETKTEFSWSTYSLWKSDNKKYDGEDNLIILEDEDDAAHVQWGGFWRMPTSEEWQELIDNCAWEDSELNGVSGILISATNGNSIFLPKAGHKYEGGSYYRRGHVCDYWASTLDESSPKKGCAIRDNTIRSDWRYNGFAIRAVLDLF